MTHGATPNLVNDKGQSAVLIATLFAFGSVAPVETVSVLLNYGEEPDMMDDEGSQALFVAACHPGVSKYDELGSLLVRRGALRNLLSKMVLCKSIGTDLSLRTPHYSEMGGVMDPLLIDLCNGNTVSALDRLMRGTSCLDSRTSRGWTPLMCAARLGRPDVVTFLMAQGASRNLVNNKGQSAVLIATTYAFGSVAPVETVDALLAFGEDPDTFDKSGLRALFVAACYPGIFKYERLIQVLVGRGAQLHVNNLSESCLAWRIADFELHSQSAWRPAARFILDRIPAFS
jgi:hypothetical protein